MFDRDDLFPRRNPFGAFAEAIAKAPSPDLSFDAAAVCSAWAGRSKKEILDHLLSCPAGADLRPTVMRAIHGQGMLIDAFEALQVTAIYVSSRVARQSRQIRRPNGALREAEQAVKTCVLQEQRRFAEKVDVASPLADHHASLHHVFEIPLSKLRYATTRINDLADDQRLPLVRVFLQGIPINEVVMQSQRSLMDLTTSMKVGLMTLQLEQINGSD